MFLTDTPVIHEVAYKTYSINCMGMESPMLFVGTQKALLVDTGCGNADLKALVRTLTDLPLIVCVTHEHADHVGGIVQFEEVFVPEQELSTIAGYDTDFMQHFLDFFNDLIEEEPGTNGCFKQQRTVWSWDKKPVLKPIHDGDKWNLGGRTVTAYHCPVHSKGHMVFVDDLSRILYAGDSIGDSCGPANNPINPPTCVSVETMIRGLEHVKSHEQEYDRIFGGHNGWGGHLERTTSFEPAVVDRMLDIARDVLAGKAVIFLDENIAEGRRNYATKGKTTLYFFAEYLKDTDL
ncbi:MAG: MBL fold metallo-hydrolase [Clostridiales bacterium]|nr:MBL fold metallo-hydrolase [Clostridiales bacterium]